MAQTRSDVNAVDVAKTLKGIDFPAGKQGLINHAKQNNADEPVLQVLQQLPDREYQNMADVEKAVGDIL